MTWKTLSGRLESSEKTIAILGDSGGRRRRKRTGTRYCNAVPSVQTSGKRPRASGVVLDGQVVENVARRRWFGTQIDAGAEGVTIRGSPGRHCSHYG